jgi:ribosome-associated protein
MATVTVTATHLVLHRTVHLPISEVQLSTTTSSGPGGQHANRTQSKVIGRIDLTTISGLGPVLRQRAIDALGQTVEASSQAQRSQVQNKAAVLQRLAEKIDAALVVSPPRRATRPTKASATRRVDAKQRRSSVKQNRRRPTSDD